MHQSYPNPFNPVTKVRFDLPEHSEISINVYDVESELIEVIFSGIAIAGEYESQWDGSEFSSGIYLLVLQTNYYRNTRRMVLIK
ncbi:MAG: T9SS type A sorting domain-containing protein [Ignavibacteria bacterium]|nr:T9SS type A sorting domain-containing protein [Ignavibacteria bacterium]MCC7158143.1 T9SS type A sorting domain-containing protein [Ignavibacteria bacterium]